MSKDEAFAKYNERFPDCHNWLDFVFDGKAQMDGNFTLEQIRFIADLMEQGVEP